MPFVTHFKSPTGEVLPISAASKLTVEIPAAGSADLRGWSNTMVPGKYARNVESEAFADSAILPSCTDPSVITDHGLEVSYDKQAATWVLQLDSLPAAACTLTLLFITCENDGVPFMLPLGGDGSAGGGGLPVVEITSAEYPEAVDGMTSEVALSEQESAALTAAVNSGLPVRIKLFSMGMSLTFPTGEARADGVIMLFSPLIIGTQFVFTAADGTNWTMGG